MARHRTLAQFELFVLIAIRALGDEAWSVAIEQLLEDTGGRSTSLGAVYVTLRRLETKGLVRAMPIKVEGSRRPRNYYRLTASGARELNATTDLVQRMISLGGDST
ncbi:MAG: PadR family transcriptional regulator [Acidobacteria bacterium]|nr:PadR family transcriptional regulator [Acidobacteriota bacterium]